MRLPRRQYWLGLCFGAAVTLATGLVGGRELDGMPASIKTWGLPLPWLKRTGPTVHYPSLPVRWSVPVLIVCFPLDTLFWSLPALLVLRSRHHRCIMKS